MSRGGGQEVLAVACPLIVFEYSAKHKGVERGVPLPKAKTRSSVNQQVKARLSAVRDFLAGRSGEEKLADASDKATREVVGAELLAAMSGRPAVETSPKTAERALGSDTQEVPRPDANEVVLETSEQQSQQAPQSVVGASLVDLEHSENSNKLQQERARRLFLDHGYFDEAVQDLRGAKSPAERAAAARALGLFGSQRGTAHLIAAMFDNDPEVCSAAEEALGQISDPMVAKVSGSEVSTGQAEKATKAKPAEPATVNSITVENEITVQQMVNDPSDSTVTIPAATDEENQILLEEQAVKETVEQLGRQIVEITSALNEAENEVRWRIEREGKLRVEAAERRREEEELQKRAVEEAQTRRAQEREAVAAEQAARLKSESDAQRYSDEQMNLRLKAARLRLAGVELGRQRAEMETARQEAAEAAQQAELGRARDEAKARHQAELKRLRNEEAALQTESNEVAIQQTNLKAARAKATREIARLKKEQAAAETTQRAEAERLRREGEEKNSQAEELLRVELEALRHADEEVDARRAEVEAARAKAEAEAERLVEAQARMRGAEDARAQAEGERLRLEAEINQQVETQLRLLEETRRRGEEEHERAQEDLRRQAEAEQKRLAELEVVRTRAEVESKQRAEKEAQILSQIDSLRIADAETRRRIEDAEVRRRAADDAYRLVAEKVQRVEAEAHARAKEEERILAKLETERRTVAVEAQSRTEQEKRIRDEIEMFRRLEEEERPRIEEATLQLAAAEGRLQERKDRLRDDEAARALAEEELSLVNQYQASPVDLLGGPASQYESGESVAPHLSLATAETPSADASVLAEGVSSVDATDRGDDTAGSPVTPAIATYLNSVDPYKRAAAVAELARSGGQDAFSQIVECFDDHSSHVRNAAARALRKLEPSRTVDLFNRALEEASPDRRRNIGGAIAASGLATDAINNLASENREDTYNALSILFVMAKTGEVEPLVRALEEHNNDEIGKAVTKLLSLSGHQLGTQTVGGGA